MNKKMDFILKETDFCRILFRFYPKNTHVHGFTDIPPRTWKEVYKVYYSWAIIYQNVDNGKINSKYNKTLLYFPCDECSEIPNLSGYIKYVIETGVDLKIPACGQPAGDWIIQQKKGKDWHGNEYEDYYFELFDNWMNQGYKFTLSKEKALDFCDYLDAINQYALYHSEGI